ncbi:hypothetical protein NL676_009966 [Syzygium grande]|nr:hypothetical protein NL676_009966 [Syzygium grande]
MTMEVPRDGQRMGYGESSPDGFCLYRERNPVCCKVQRQNMSSAMTWTNRVAGMDWPSQWRWPLALGGSWPLDVMGILRVEITLGLSQTRGKCI